MLPARLGFIPDNAIVISDQCAIAWEDGRLAVFNSGGVIFSAPDGDRQGVRTAMGMLASLGLASVTQLAEAFGVSRNTIYNNRDAYERGGVAALADARGPRGGYKLTAEKLAAAQGLLNAGGSVRGTARALGVSHTALQYALRQGWLRPGDGGAPVGSADPGSRPSARSAADASCEGGIGVKRTEERLLARTGALDEAPAVFEAAEAVSGAGVLLALPALLGEGLVETAETIYGRLKNGFFGLRSVLLTLAFMALLRIRSAEQLKGHAPGELGLALGLDRAPEMKTLRRKLREIGARGLARQLAEALARRWMSASPGLVGMLYIDGHVRPYHGRKYRLPKTFVPRRRLCLPATTDVWVHDAAAQPWLFVTAAANDGLLSMLDKEILPDVRAQVGAGRRVTLVFDREGWSPETFQRWFKAGFDVLTYRKGRYAPWPEAAFDAFEDPAQAGALKPKVYRLAEDEARFGKGGSFRMREVRRLCANGHQTSVLTTRRDLPIAEVASRMFARWRQENFFRYMRHEFALDHLCCRAVEPDDPVRLVPNPLRRQLKKDRERFERQAGRLERKKKKMQDLREADAGSTRRQAKRGAALAALEQQIQEVETRIEECRARFAEAPEKVPFADTLDGQQAVKLEAERKIFTDLIRTIAYRAESAMLAAVGPLLSRDAEEGRAFLKAVFQTPADLIPSENGEELLVRFHSMAQPRFNRALRALCEAATAQQITYPGTRRRMVYQGPPGST